MEKLKFSDVAKRLDEISTYSGMRAFLKDELQLERIGSGSGREVFVFDDNHVIKMAKNAKGVAQNLVESDRGIDSWYGNIIARTVDYDDEKHKYLLSERACGSIKSQVGLKKAVEKAYGIDGDDFIQFLEHLNTKIMSPNRFNYNEYNKITDKYEDSNFLSDMSDMIINYSMPTGDMQRHSTWGMVGDRLCLKDYGLTKDVFDEFYERKSRGYSNRMGM